MIRKMMSYWLCGILLITMSTLPGCADSTELSDLAIEQGIGLDQTGSNLTELTAQFVMPSKLGIARTGSKQLGEAYFTESGTGQGVLRAFQDLQEKVSRRIFRSQRREIVIGEKLARHGIKDMVDTFVRDQTIRFRTAMFVAKDGTAADLLTVSMPLEGIPSLGTLKLHDALWLGAADVTFRDFLMAGMDEGICPTLPAIQVVRSGADDNEHKNAHKQRNIYNAGFAVFDHQYKLVDFLSTDESRVLRWLRGELSKQIIEGYVPQGKGIVGVDVMKMKSRLEPVIHGQDISMNVHLSGEGSLRESQTNLDVTKNLPAIEQALGKVSETQVLQTIQRVQKQDGTDIFGFGDAIHRKYPRQWGKLKSNWPQEFRKIHTSIQVKLAIRRIGSTGPSPTLPGSSEK